MRDIYLYDNSNVLKNKLGIMDISLLEAAEGDYVSLRLKELAQNPLEGTYDYRHFLKFHEYIFQDIYEWAGQQRKVNLFKEEDVLGGLSVEYSDMFDIAKDMTSILNRMNSREWCDFGIEELTKTFSEDFAALWKVHCFREGNTRTVITFCCQYADEHGFHIDRTIFEENSLYVRNALVAYNAVFHDLGDLSKPQYLETIIRDAFKQEK